MKYRTKDALVASKTTGATLVHDVVTKLADFTDGKDVTLDFLTRDAVAEFSKGIGIDRNWAELDLDEIAPEAEDEAVNVVPQAEAVSIITVLKHLLEHGDIEPEAEGTKAPHLINDFLPAGETFLGAPCLGHLWEFRYALAVELEHGVTRGTNVTQNHPLLTGMVVLAHLAEDTLYYARLWVMETEGELFNAQLAGDAKEILETLEHLTLAQKHLAARIDEKIVLATKGSLPDQAS